MVKFDGLPEDVVPIAKMSQTIQCTMKSDLNSQNIQWFETFWQQELNNQEAHQTIQCVEGFSNEQKECQVQISHEAQHMIANQQLSLLVLW